MWRFVSRSIRKFRQHEHSAFGPNRRRNVRNVKTEDKSLTASVINFDKHGFGSTKEDKTRGENDQKWETRFNWQDAVGWSGAIAIGWVVCQSLCLRKSFDEFLSKSTIHIPKDFHLTDFITEIKKLEPRKMLSISHLQNREDADNNVPIAFGSINTEEFDMLVHRQQSF